MGFTAFIADYITQFIGSTGYVTVFLGMILESMIFPIPSEAIMPFAGFLIAEGKFNFPLVILISTLGSLAGSLLSYCMGYYGGHPFVNKFGKYFLIDQEELDFTEKFFKKNGQVAIFICRFIPIIRHLISLPAGMAKMDLWRFSVLTVIGAGLWNTFLTVVGYRLRQNWELVIKYSKVVDDFMIILILILIALYIYRHIHKKRKLKKAE
jgi:membrane protein DedA with SNARE-associated domain